jgi:hypothetical protein
VPVQFPGGIEAPAVILNNEPDATSADVKFDVGLRAAGVADGVVDALFEDQKHLAAHVRPQPHVVRRAGGAEVKFDAARGEHVAGEAAHPLRQIAQVILLRINRPHDVAHRIDQL